MGEKFPGSFVWGEHAQIYPNLIVCLSKSYYYCSVTLRGPPLRDRALCHLAEAPVGRKRRSKEAQRASI